MRRAPKDGEVPFPLLPLCGSRESVLAFLGWGQVGANVSSGAALQFMYDPTRLAQREIAKAAELGSDRAGSTTSAGAAVAGIVESVNAVPLRGGAYCPV